MPLRIEKEFSSVQSKEEDQDHRLVHWRAVNATFCKLFKSSFRNLRTRPFQVSCTQASPVLQTVYSKARKAGARAQVLFVASLSLAYNQRAQFENSFAGGTRCQLKHLSCTSGL